MSVSAVKFIRPEAMDIAYIADNMRDADAAEVMAMSGSSPLNSLLQGVRRSEYKSVITINDEPCAVLGLKLCGLLSDRAVPWMLGTDLVVENKRLFITETAKVIEQMVKIRPLLYNYTHYDNKVIIRWLKYCGFNVHKPVPMGINNELFCKFTMGDW